MMMMMIIIIYLTCHYHQHHHLTPGASLSSACNARPAPSKNSSSLLGG